VDVRDVLSQTEVVLGVALVPDQPQEVKPGEEGGRELDVGLRRLLHVVAAERRVGSGQDGHPGIQGCHDAGLEGEEQERAYETDDSELHGSSEYYVCNHIK